MKLLKSFLFIILLCCVVGCATWNKLSGTERGAVIGGASGAAVGNAVGGRGAGGTLLGGAAGAVGGGLIGREMDRRDRRRY